MLNLKLFRFQLPLSIMTALINFYCLLALMFYKKLRRLDFYLVFVQTVVDFLISGLFAIFYNAGNVIYFVSYYCYYEAEYFIPRNRFDTGIDE